MAEQTTSGMKYRTLSTPVDTGIHQHMEAVMSTIVRLGDIEVHEVKTTLDLNGQYYTVLATQTKRASNEQKGE